MNEANLQKVRIDKWLWAARFFKTRGLAKKAIEGGKVHVEGHRTKPSKDIEVGMTLQIRQGWDERIVIVNKLSEQRRGAPEAQMLYTETPESIAKRELEATQRKAGQATILSEGRPTKKQRRQIHRFIQDTND
ncbi:MAG: RNA-binding protein [Cellvibrionaceae bacterium]